MSLSVDERREIESLISQLNSEDLDDSKKQELENLLKAHPEAIELYLDQYEAEAMLRETYGSLNPVVSQIKREQRGRASVWRLATAAAVLLAVFGGVFLAIGRGLSTRWYGVKAPPKSASHSDNSTSARNAELASD